jgi:DNA polymerase III epsilon subunit-like protein
MSERILLFDVETTGKADFKRHVLDPCQPRIVQLAALLVEDDHELACLNVVIEPDGFLISDDAARIHGITNARARDIGIPIAPVLESFHSLIERSSWIVGHNIAFDIFVAQVEFAKRSYANPFLEKPTFCTMKSSTDICRLPGQYGYKWPKLSEVYLFAFQEELVDAHNAMTDLRATFHVYNWLRNLLTTKTLTGQPA